MTEKDYKKELKDKLIKYRSSLNLPSDITFGVEIEYTNIVKDTVSYLLNEEHIYNNLIGWKNKSEFDIAFYNKKGEEENGEVVSPILKDNLNTWKELRDVLNLLNRNNGLITDKCGGHVNIGTQIFGNNNEYYRNLFLLWILYEKEIYKFASGEFKNIRYDNDNLFAKISSSMCLNTIVNIDREMYLDYLNFILFDKRHAIYIWSDFTNKVIDGDRIEFRIPNGTLSEEIWQNNINFFAKLLIACKKELDIEKILYKINNNDHSIIELADLVFDNDIDKEYFLIQSLKTNKIYKKNMPKHIDFISYK